MKFSVATAAHDPELRRLARAEPMPGWIRLAFTHEPDWAASQQVLGRLFQTVVATDEAGAVVGCGVRAIRRVYVNGRPMDLGYLAGLRSVVRARRALGLAQGYRYLHGLHAADRLVPAYLTTIVEANREAVGLLTAARAGLPAYLDQGCIITSAILLDRHRRASAPPAGVEIRGGDELPFDEIVGFLNAEGGRSQFFPVLERDELNAPWWRGLQPAGFRVALRAGRIVGVAAAWDQASFRQMLVTGYAPLLRLARPAFNGLLRATGRRALPPPGEFLRCFHLAFTCVRNHDPAVLAGLVERFHRDFRDSAYDCFIVGLHERNPARHAVSAFRRVQYKSRLYLACWEDGRPFCAGLDRQLVPHIETATL